MRGISRAVAARWEGSNGGFRDCVDARDMTGGWGRWQNDSCRPNAVQERTVRLRPRTCLRKSFTARISWTSRQRPDRGGKRNGRYWIAMTPKPPWIRVGFDEVARSLGATAPRREAAYCLDDHAQRQRLLQTNDVGVVIWNDVRILVGNEDERDAPSLLELGNPQPRTAAA